MSGPARLTWARSGLGLLALALSGAALAGPGPPVGGSAGAWGALGEQARPDLVGGGLGASLALRLWGPLHLDLAGEAGLDGQADPWLGARPELRLFLTPRQAPAGSLSLLGGGGLRWTGSLRPDLSLGAALDLPGRGRLIPRLQARYLLDPTGGGSTLQAGLGLAWPRPDAPEAPAAPAPPLAPTPPTPPAAPLSPPTSAALRDWTWVPHPVSACVEAGRLRGPPGSAGADDDLVDPLVGPQAVGPQAVALPAGLDLQALLNPTQGSLVVAAFAGDEVTVGGRVVPLGTDATAVTNAPEGPIEVRIRGGGQVQVLQPAIASGYAVWVRSRPDAAPITISFAQGSAVVTPDALETLANLARDAGGWRFELRGSYSPEGDPDRNRALAQARAASVREALLAAGLPADRIVLAPVPTQVPPYPEAAAPEAADPGTADPETAGRQRACLVVPLPPEAP